MSLARSDHLHARSCDDGGSPTQTDGSAAPLGPSGQHALVDEARRQELRRLAVWLARRRAVDDAVEQLTAYGPAAAERVHDHLAALTVLLQAEAQAFETIRALAPDVPQRPLRDAADVPAPASVHSLGDARRRRDHA